MLGHYTPHELSFPILTEEKGEKHFWLWQYNTAGKKKKKRKKKKANQTALVQRPEEDTRQSNIQDFNSEAWLNVKPTY